MVNEQPYEKSVSISGEPVAWLFQNEETGLTECVDVQQVERGFEKNNPRWQKIAPLYTAPQPAIPPGYKPVAYLDVGAQGFLDLGSDLSDDQLSSLPKGRHMLGIIGTYGVDGYKAAALEEPQPDDTGRDWSLLEATQESLREHMQMVREDTALLRQALEVLERCGSESYTIEQQTIAALRERLK